jgi:hypothetical protein
MSSSVDQRRLLSLGLDSFVRQGTINDREVQASKTVVLEKQVST